MSTKASSVEVQSNKKILNKKKVQTGDLVKNMKKMSINEKIETPKKSVNAEEKPKKKKVDVEKKVETSKESTKKSKKVEETDKPEKAEKIPKKINIKPTISDTQGLNLSVAKVRNIVSNMCINKETSEALIEMKNARDITEYEDEDNKKPSKFTFDFDNLSDNTIAYLEACQHSTMESYGLVHSRKVIKDFDSKKLKNYNNLKQEAINKFQATQRIENLFSQDKFDLTAFNLEYDSSFYVNMTEYNANWKDLENEELYSYCVNLVTKNKVRFNSESKVYITAFVEYIIKQLVINGTINCVSDKKKIIQLNHAVNDISPEFSLFPFISNTDVYRKYMHPDNNSSSSDDELEEGEIPEEDEEDDNDDDDEEGEIKSVDSKSDRKLQFKYYVAELCRNVRMELSKKDDDYLTSLYNQTSVSKVFNQFCSDVIIELLHRFGKVLKTEVVTRDVKTVNYSIVSALIYNSHILFGLESDNTVQFIQEKYNLHNVYLNDRASARAEKTADKDSKPTAKSSKKTSSTKKA